MARCVNTKKRNSLQNRRAKKRSYKVSAGKTASHVVNKVNHSIVLGSSSVKAIEAAEDQRSVYQQVPTTRLARVGKNNSIVAANKLSKKKIRLLQKAANRKLSSIEKSAGVAKMAMDSEAQFTNNANDSMDKTTPTSTVGTILGAPSS